jgi:SHS2 domain-containing protein
MLSGDLMDTKRQRFKRDVKAVTYHEMEIKKGAKEYVIRFLLDL